MAGELAWGACIASLRAETPEFPHILTVPHQYDLINHAVLSVQACSEHMLSMRGFLRCMQEAYTLHAMHAPCSVYCHRPYTMYLQDSTGSATCRPLLSSWLALFFAAAFATPTFAAREEPVIDAKQAAEMAANEAASPFIALIKMLMGGDTGAAANDDAKTVAELAQNAPGNMSLLVDGVERAGLHTAIADPNFEATIFAPTNWVGPFCKNSRRGSGLSWSCCSCCPNTVLQRCCGSIHNAIWLPFPQQQQEQAAGLEEWLAADIAAFCLRSCANCLIACPLCCILQAFEVALVKLRITPAQLWTDKTALTNLLR